MLISKKYAELNRQLHQDRPDYGCSSKRWIGHVYQMARDEEHETILDYGCGKGLLNEGLVMIGSKPIAEYDPAVPGKDGEPEPADLVVMTDVFEHIEPEHLNAVLRHVHSKCKRRFVFSISTRAAGKVLEDGRNAHLIIKDGEWWRAKLMGHFQITFWQERDHEVVGEAIPMRKGQFIIRPEQHKLTAKRRPFPQGIFPLFDHIRGETNKYGDAYGAINKFHMWEGGIEEQHSDCQVAFNILDQMEDVQLALMEMCALSDKGVIVMQDLRDLRDEKMWKRILEANLRLSDWQVQADGKLLCIGSHKVAVEGIIPIGAVDVEKRWEQVKAAAARFPRRFDAAPAHDRVAIIACYGPSLASQIDIIKREAGNPRVDVFSVSGAHDFLLDHGIVPDGHIECDPRPHKADNIKEAHPDVTYFIASCVHEQLLDKLPVDQVRLWHAASGDHNRRIVNELGEPGTTMVSGGGSVGLRSLILLYNMGYRDLWIFAMDCSFADEGKAQWAGKHAGKPQDISIINCSGRAFYSSPQLMTYATGFFEQIKKLPDCGYRLYGDGLLQHWNRMMNEQLEEKAA